MEYLNKFVREYFRGNFPKIYEKVYIRKEGASQLANKPPSPNVSELIKKLLNKKLR